MTDLRARIDAIDAMLTKLKAERVEVLRAIANERLVNLGRKAVLLRDAGISVGEIARMNQVSRAMLIRAIDAWREHEGMASSS